MEKPDVVAYINQYSKSHINPDSAIEIYRVRLEFKRSEVIFITALYDKYNHSCPK